jgi:hypothetical protein
MSEILTSTITILVLIAFLAAVVSWARRDSFATSSMQRRDRGAADLGPAIETGRRVSAP